MSLSLKEAFPCLLSYLRRLIHKTVEENFPDLITFSVGSGIFRRTIVAFRVACERGPLGLQLMSTPSPKVSRGRGSGRGRELTSSERVAQWVSEREERRLNKERWANPSSFSNLQEYEYATKSCTESESISERSKNKRQGAQIYVPLSLRDKKLNAADLTKSLSTTESKINCCKQNDEVIISGNLDIAASVKHKESVHTASELETNKLFKGRGRGRKKPEVELYVPRALRGQKSDYQQNNEERNSFQDQSDFVQMDDTACKNLEKDNADSYQTLPEIEETLSDKLNNLPPERPDFHVDNTEVKNEPTLSDCNMSLEHHNTSWDEINGNAASDLKSCFRNETVHIPNLDCSELRQDVSIVDSDHTGSTSNSFTFEFYDSAVIAFLPSPPVQNQTFSLPMFQEQPSVNILNPTQLPSCGLSKLSNCEDVHDSDINNSAIVPEQNLLTAIPVIDKMNTNSNHTPFNSVAENNVEMLVPNLCTVQSKPELSEKNSNKKQKMKKKTKEPSLAKEIKSRKGKNEPDLKSDKKSLSIPPVPRGCTSDIKQKGTSSKDNVQNENGDVEEDSWDTLFDENGDCLDDSMMKELTEYVGQVEIDKPKINYLKYEPKEIPLDTEAFSHIIEIYDFSPELATCDLVSAFRDFSSRGFDVKWVDDTHALGVFSSATAANEALKMIHPLFKVRSMSEASKMGQQKAKHCQEFLQPYKARPETTSIAARRLVAGALGMAPRVSREVRDQERQKLKEAKEKRRQERQQKNDVWDGSVGKCAMDEEDQSLR
ncbi:hypothetical protein Btru_027090 [Bulinus truncatus]|nr:hypothetical protein Btru_027090 [Bulinus truncatus]